MINPREAAKMFYESVPPELRDVIIEQMVEYEKSKLSPDQKELFDSTCNLMQGIFEADPKLCMLIIKQVKDKIDEQVRAMETKFD